jgi:formamidopyrimidine-DNA glycosylase
MARVRLSDASGFDLTDAGQWKALTIHIVRSPTDVPAVAKLGLDPLEVEFDTAAFAAILANRKKQIKALLQDQTAFAGIGNAYSDEILHAAKISPVTHAASLSTDAVERLAHATRAVLAEATSARRGVPPSELRATKHAALRVHRKTGAACPVCGDEIRQYTFSGAAAQYCPTCQTGGALLA